MNVQLAKTNLEASVREAGFDWIVEVERGDDFTVRLWNGPQEFLKKNVSRGILEDESSPFRDKLIQDARLVLERPQAPPPRPGWTPRGPKMKWMRGWAGQEDAPGNDPFGGTGGVQLLPRCYQNARHQAYTGRHSARPRCLLLLGLGLLGYPEYVVRGNS